MNPRPDDLDHAMMTRCIALSRSSGEAGEYPYGAVIVRQGEVVTESMNRVAHDGDVTCHAEVVAISAAQKLLGTVSLDDCTIYVNAEPCVFCGYAIRESRICRVVYGLHSPHMGSVSRWNVLEDEGLSREMPEVFAPPPEIVPGFMADEAEEALRQWNPLIATFIRERGLFATAPGMIGATSSAKHSQNRTIRDQIMRFLRRHLFDHFGRR